MNRSSTNVRRALLALAFVGALGFGATQAVAAPEQARTATCSETSGSEIDYSCARECRRMGYYWGTCDGGVCSCEIG
jgi:hypothetical protein